ncbi:putative Mg(2+) transport ATPase [Acholeplasma oculi]|uniref:MgtC/SapB/SrpB transporter family protein n=1 Tax=Acholeplasma oculi TaxID=35623 RepID=A0A061AKG9_9MOLU|nr:MgtC/SapB family protein [Acholeplasma oculi]CDR31527.1 MgtC/SapB/SrpB transporter family protein [Acholeplasma oculi]SKC49697.1 putative Mg2+ transporter-C (MgtC) family protein [Acholeplasma oculi]SUT92365.1 putative Mg(2+) transport ATPase [Acholeplasma oculi]
MHTLFQMPDGYDMIQSFLTWEQWLYMILIPGFVVVIVKFFIGMERQNVGKAAGISAHILVGLSALMISFVQRASYLSEVANGIGDPEGQRIIAQVVTGIGFIGAGVIMKDSRNIIHGITTAATIWFSALLGIVLGMGYLYEGTLFGVFVVLFIFLRDLKRGVNPFKPTDDEKFEKLHIDKK